MSQINLGRVGVVPKGAWSTGDYKRLDLVTYGGLPYLAIKDTGNIPTHSDWMLITPILDNNGDGSKYLGDDMTYHDMPAGAHSPSTIEKQSLADDDLITIFDSEDSNAPKLIKASDMANYLGITFPESNPFGDGSQVFYFPLDNNANDNSGNGNSGVATNLTYTTGKVGTAAASFNGSSSKIELPFNIPIGFTFTCWVKTTTTSGNFFIFDDGHQYGHGIYFNNGNVRYIAGNNGSYIVDGSISGVNDGTWHHLAVCWDGQSGTNVYIYVDGVQNIVDTSTAAKTLNTTYSTTYIGNRRDVNAYFTGQLDSVRLFDRVLTIDEINYIFSNEGGI